MRLLKKCLFTSYILLSGIMSCAQVNIDFTGPVYNEDLYYEYKSILDISRTTISDNVGTSKPILIAAPIVHFISDTFQQNANFSSITFHNEVDFEGSIFRKEVLFTENLFQQDAAFNSVTFEDKADFTDATFEKSASFHHLILTKNSNLIFNGTTLPRRINFSYNSQITNEVDFADAHFKEEEAYSDTGREWHNINLYRTEVSKIKIDYRHFRLYFFSSDTTLDALQKKIDTNSRGPHFLDIHLGNTYFELDSPQIAHLLFQNAEIRDYIFTIFPYCKYPSSDDFFATIYFKAIQLCWDGYICNRPPPLRDSVIVDFLNLCAERRVFPKRLPDDKIKAIYEKVLKTFADQGQLLGRQKLDIEYQDFKNGANILPHIWNCYGYHKEWVFYWTAILLVLFTFITFCCVNFLHEHVYTVSFFSADDVKWMSTFSRLWYSFVYTCVLFFLFTLKMENFKFSKTPPKILGSFYVLIVYTAGIACIAYMANFVLQK